MNIPNLKNIAIGAVILTLIILLVISRCSTKKQDKANTDIAVSQNQIENYESRIAELKHDSIAYNKTQDSLYRVNSALNKLLIQKEAKYAQIVSNGEIRKDSIIHLTGDSAFHQFLSTAGRCDLPIMKIKENYLVHPDMIKFYNTMTVDLDTEDSLNNNLQDQKNILTTKLKEREATIQSNNEHIVNLNEQVKQTELITVEDKKQNTALTKKLKQQKIKTIAVEIGGLILIGAALVL